MNPPRHLFLATCGLLLLVAGGCGKRASQLPMSSDDTAASGLGDGQGTSTRPGRPSSGDGSQTPDGRFLSADAGFSIVFPTKPRDQFVSKEGLVTRTYSIEKDKELLAVGLTQLADDVKKQLAGADVDARQRVMNGQFDRARDATIGDGRLLSEQRLILDEFPGMVCEFQYELQDDKVGRQRLYLANDTLYAVIARGDRDFVTSDEADKFFASFKLLDKSTQRKE
jgi:hypothetical protein